MRLAAPAALIGVIIGEWFGAPRGLGVLMINAMQNFQIPLLWSAILLTVATSIVLFASLGVLERVVAERFR
jgi:NitT/TauT family transport system permease protein